MRRFIYLLAYCAAAAAAAAALAQAPPIPATSFTLPNGLRVVVNEDHSEPLVAVDLWYRLGSADEGPRQRGFAHLCEHLMGFGSPSEPEPQIDFFSRLGVSSPGAFHSWATTTGDYTQFYELAPTNLLETVLWSEADLMAAPLSRASGSDYESAVDLVRRERISRVDAVPFGELIDVVRAELYPPGHPYRAGPLPPMTDIDAARPSDVVNFCHPYYVPSNAVIALSGDVSPATAKRLVERYFGRIARGDAPARVIPQRLPLADERRLVLQDDRARANSIHFAWQAVGFNHPDKMPLYALAGVLSGDKYGFGRFGRLSRVLIDEKALATRVHAEVYDALASGEFIIDVTPRPGASLTDIENAVDSVIDVVRNTPVSNAELTAFGRLNSVNALVQLQSRLSRTDTLAQSELWAQNPDAFWNQIVAGGHVTASDVQRVAREYLTRGRIVLSAVPANSIRQVSKPTLPYKDVTPASAKKRPVPVP